MTSAIAAIHTGCKQLGIDEDGRRTIYERITGKPSLTLMSSDEKDAVVTELRRLGFTSADRRTNGQQKLTGKFAKKLQALWIAAWNLGVVEKRDDKALTAFVKRQTGIDHTRWLNYPDDARAVIEALKSWLRREAGVSFGNTNGQEWLAADGAKIAWAQWRILHPGVSLIVRKGFDEEVSSILGVRHAWLADVKPKEWQTVMNAFGERVRAARKAGK
ncbi:phage gp16-like protein [Rhizobium subbaraonis]|uniref:Phage gp16-like protein n=1 Tax=Rhizobium subbaraonis TaxID=908946 RepID=A0A285UID3_9HYPH|nr:regulatory protein GemA [Rhizobium subbaraonis]SOC41609.1 phage gp16-like protein [Rhizobium subbaraonis]